ncbi:MAG TPA: erythromycin esterase family protein [Aggregatilineaceae bacterium]|nr:erythromycin esterase family protein [Aggregatilineaceae bacterium]
MAREEWIQQESIPFAMDATLNAAIDRVMAREPIDLLGLGEPLHGGEDFLMLRNRIFQRLVEAHGFSAIAVESSFPKGHLINDYVAGRGSDSYEAIKDAGFSHGFGQLEANRELVEWMRTYNATHPVQLQFYGFDSPTEMMGTDSPRQVLAFVLDYLTSVDERSGQMYRQQIEPLLGQDAAWENPAAMMDPTQAIGLSPEATALRIETEDLISELQARRPELVAKSDSIRYREALQYAAEARQLLNYHAELARASEQRTARLLGMRDAMMADNVAYIVERERRRGKVFLFAHNSHLKRSKVEWQRGPDLLTWWPVGAQLSEMFGSRYVIIGSALGVSAENGIGQPEAGTLEALLTATPGPGRFFPTAGHSKTEIAALPVRSGSTVNFSYFPLTPQSFTDFDWFVALDSTGYQRGGPPLPTANT